MLKQIDLVAPQELVLLFLQEHGRTPQSEIVYFLGRDRSTVTNGVPVQGASPSSQSRAAMAVTSASGSNNS